MIGSVYTWFTLNQYVASYLHNNGHEEIKQEDTAFLMPSIFLVGCLFLTIGVKLGNCMGPRLITFFSVLFMCGSFAVLYFFKDNLYFVLGAMGLFGLGEGLGNLSVIKNCWKYFPNRLGLINGVIIGGLGLSSCALTPIADYFILNSSKNKPIDGYYSQSITNNWPTYLLIVLILFGVLGLLAIVLTFKYEDEDVNLDDLDDGSKSSCKLICEGFFSEKNFFLLLFCFCGPCN